MAIQRLSGGLTPADGADPRTFPTIWNDFADQGDPVLTGADSQYHRIRNLSLNDFTDVDVNEPLEGNALLYDGSSWRNKTSFGTNTFADIDFDRPSFGDFTSVTFTWNVPLDFPQQYCRITLLGGAGGGGDRLPGPTEDGGDGGTTTMIDLSTSELIGMAVGGKGGKAGGSLAPGQDATPFGGGDLYNSSGRPIASGSTSSERSRGTNGAPGASKVFYHLISPGDSYEITIGNAGYQKNGQTFIRYGGILVEYNDFS